MARNLGGRAVNPIGFGCMNLSHAYGTPPATEDAERVLLAALDLGCDHLDTARLYGLGANEELVGRVLSARRGEFYLASKMGIMTNPRRIDCRPETIRVEVDKSLAALRTDHIDLYYLHRRDFDTPIADSVGALADLVAAGKIGGIGLSEVSAETLRAAHAVHPVTAVQQEYSLWTRNVEIAMLDASRELGVALVAFSPLGRGALGGELRDPATLRPDDIRVRMPRFWAEHWPANLALIDRFSAIAAEEGVTPAQLALAWVLSRGDHVHVIPGTSRLDHLRENVARGEWRPDAAVLDRVDALINRETVSGPRYNESMQRGIDTEEFA